MPNLLIIEPHCSGHRAGYVRWIAQAAVDRGYHVQVATFELSAHHPLFLAMQKELGEMLQMVMLDDEFPAGCETSSSGLIKREFYYWRLLGRFYAISHQARMPDIVLVPYLDYCSNAIALLGSPFGQTSWVGVVMRPAFHFALMGILAPHSRMPWLKKRLFLRLLSNKTLCALFTIDEALDRFMRETQLRLSKRLYYLPDPAKLEGTISKEEARRGLGIPSGAIVILVYGTIDLRKGIDALFRAIMSNVFPADLHVIVAGQQGEEGHAFLDSKKVQSLSSLGRVHQLNKFLSEEEEYTVFKASDIVWLGYRDHYVMSGVMVQAGKMGLPVIACKEGLIGWMTAINKSGVVVDIYDPAEVYGGIFKLAQDSSFAAECGRNGVVRFEGHTVEAFSKAIIDVF